MNNPHQFLFGESGNHMIKLTDKFLGVFYLFFNIYFLYINIMYKKFIGCFKRRGSY